MKESDLFKTAYAEFWDITESRRLVPNLLVEEFLDYNEYESEATEFIYGQQEQTFTENLLNDYHRFLTHVNSLIIWEEVISKYSEEDQINLGHEFTLTDFYFCLLQPHEFEQRLIFSATQLCYTHGLNMRKIKKEAIQKDNKISLKDLKKLENNWVGIKELLESLEKVNGKSSFVLATKEFRNRRQHRLPPRLSFGTTATVKRTFLEDNSIGYGFGYEKPLIFNEVLPELLSQAKLMRVAFQNYWKLVQEHCSEMNKLETSIPLP
jgi:hypothetical protein